MSNRMTPLETLAKRKKIILGKCKNLFSKFATKRTTKQIMHLNPAPSIKYRTISIRFFIIDYALALVL